MSSASIHERFDKLIKLGKTLLPYQKNLKYLAEKEKWETQCQVLLERAFGKSSVYLKKFQAIMTYANEEAHITHGISLMEGAKEELEFENRSGKLDKIKREIEEEKAEAERRAAVV